MRAPFLVQLTRRAHRQTRPGTPAWLPALSLCTAALCAAGWWFQWPRPAWLLPVALLPAAVRLASTRRLVARTGFEVPLALLALTAGVGVWAAYDRTEALVKFWTLLGGLLLFMALAEQPRRHLPRLALALAVAGAALASYFLLTYDWRQHPADLTVLNRLGWAWQAWRPQLAAAPLPPNVAGGLLAMLAPLSVAGLTQARRANRRGAALAVGLALLIMGLGLALTSSRGAWMALAAGLGLWAAGVIGSRWLPAWAWGRWGLGLAGLVAAGALLLSAALVGWAMLNPADLVALVDRLPGLRSAASRLELFRNTYRLVQAFVLTGGGLAAFAGLYSRYLLGIPVLMFSYSHNLYLDVALEQGLFGLLALLTVLGGSAWRLGRHLARQPHDPFAWATLASLVGLALHGLVDDPAYAGTGTPLLLLAPGLAVAVTHGAEPKAASAGEAAAWWVRRPRLALLAGVVGLAAALSCGLHPGVQAHLYTNLGAVAMAREELAGWQNGAINTFGRVQPDAAQWLRRAVSLAPGQTVGHYRLGLLAIQANDFVRAAAHLSQARLLDPGHRGVAKALGYTFLWLGQPDRAWPLLAAVPEAPKELEYYAWWWQRQGQADLAARAAAAAAHLAQARSRQTETR